MFPSSLKNRALSAILLSLTLGLLTAGLLLQTLQAAAPPPAPAQRQARGMSYTLTMPIVQLTPMTLNPIMRSCADNDWQLTWNHSGSGIDYFEVEEAHDDDFTNADVFTTTNTFYDFSYPAGGNNLYYYRARSVDGAAYSQWSNTQMVLGNYFDNFNNAGSGWPVGNLGPGIHSYINGKYAIETLFAGFLNGTLAPDSQRFDYVVRADINFDGSLPTDGTYGLVFGSNDDASHYYFVAVYPSFGDFRVWRWDGDLYAISPYVANGAINSGTAVNQVEVARIGNNIKVTINGVDMGTWTDNTLSGATRAGIFVSSQENTPNVQARYDNFSIRYCNDINDTLSNHGAVPAPVDPGERVTVPFATRLDIQHP